MFKKTNLFIVLVALAGFVVQSAQAIIVRGEVWRKQRKDGTYQNVLCASDVHYSNLVTSINSKDKIDVRAMSEKSMAQSQKMINLLSNLPRSDIKVILEDWNTFKDGQKVLPVFLKEHTDKIGVEFLDVFASACNEQGLDVVNVEVRQKRIGAQNFVEMLPLYFNNKKAIDQLKQTCESEEALAQYGTQQIAEWKAAHEQSLVQMQEWDKLDIAVKALMEELDQAVLEIQAYDDGEQLSSYYAQEINRILESSKKTRQQMNAFDGLYLDFLDSLDRSHVPGFLRSFPISFGSSLLDMKALHNIYHAFVFDKKDVLLIMGAMHVNNVCNMLKQLGYEKIEEVGCESADCFDLQVIAQLASLDTIVENEELIREDMQVKLADWEIKKICPLLCEQQLVNLDFFDKYLSIK